VFENYLSLSMLPTWGTILETEEFQFTFFRYLIPLMMFVVTPILLIGATSFTRIYIILQFLKHGLTRSTINVNFVVVVLSLFLALYSSIPVYKLIQDNISSIPFDQTPSVVWSTIVDHIRERTNEADLLLFKNYDQDGFYGIDVLPAFILSEIKIAFQIGLSLLLPFIAIDIFVSLGLQLVSANNIPANVISLVLKVLLFINVDGWNLVTKHIIELIN
jgi:flagellar biosynthesis protein FliP